MCEKRFPELFPLCVQRVALEVEEALMNVLMENIKLAEQMEKKNMKTVSGTPFVAYTCQHESFYHS